jgi:formamidopyrimidine-DNA glycosylase
MAESLSEELERMRDFIARYRNGEPCDECGAAIERGDML